MAFSSIEGMEALYGTVNLGGSNGNPNYSFTINHQPFSSNPVIMATARYSQLLILIHRGELLSDTFAVTSCFVNATSFIVNVFIANGNSWNQVSSFCTA